MKERYFHASRVRLRVGDPVPLGYGWEGHGVYITTSPVLHYTIADLLGGHRFVYEVEPFKLRYGSCWDELIADSAIVTRFVGQAKGIMNNAPHNPKDTKRDGPFSMVRRRHRPFVYNYRSF